MVTQASLPETSSREMQAAGRLPSHTFLDLRSAHRAYLRTRKYPQKHSRKANRCRSCFEISYNKERLAKKKDLRIAQQSKDWEDGRITPDYEQHVLDTGCGATWHDRYDAHRAELGKQCASRHHEQEDDVLLDQHALVVQDNEVMENEESDWKEISDLLSDGWSDLGADVEPGGKPLKGRTME